MFTFKQTVTYKEQTGYFVMESGRTIQGKKAIWIRLPGKQVLVAEDDVKAI